MHLNPFDCDLISHRTRAHWDLHDEAARLSCHLGPTESHPCTQGTFPQIEEYWQHNAEQVSNRMGRCHPDGEDEIGFGSTDYMPFGVEPGQTVSVPPQVAL